VFEKRQVIQLTIFWRRKIDNQFFAAEIYPPRDASGSASAFDSTAAESPSHSSHSAHDPKKALTIVF
jgi:hypothetical protein